MPHPELDSFIATRRQTLGLAAGLFGWPESKIEVPTGCVIGPYELSKPPRRWVEFKYNLKRWTRLKTGGHFLAIEEPEALIAEIRAFFHGLSSTEESMLPHRSGGAPT